MGGSPDAARPAALLASRHDHHTRSHTRPGPRRDRRHRRRPGRPLHRLPPPAARPLLRHPRRRRPRRRPVAPAVGHPAALLPRRATTACPACRSPATGGPSRARTRSPTYIEQYAAHHHLPVRLGVRVESLDAGARRRLRPAHQPRHLDLRQRRRRHRDLRPDAGHPRLRRGARPARSVQLHSSEYRRPGQLREGRVLVVGASHSGTDIAYERRADPPDDLCGRDCGADPDRLRLLDRTPGLPADRLRVAARHHAAHPDGPQGDAPHPHARRPDDPRQAAPTSRSAASSGVTERVTGVRDGRPVVGDETLDVATVVWATGFRQQFRLDPPAGDRRGRLAPWSIRGVVDDAPGLYFCGLSFQYAFSSMVFAGVGRDAAYVAEHPRPPHAGEQPAPARRAPYPPR